MMSTLTLFAGSYAATVAMGLVCAYLGLFTVLRRIVFTGVALAQLAAAGVAGAFFLADSPFVTTHLPRVADLAGRFGGTVGSLGLALLGALGLQARPMQKRVTPDALVGLAYIASSALAILLVWRSTRGLAELRNILAGEVLLSREGELTSLWLGLGLVVAVHAVLRRQFLLVAFDPEFAQALGLPERRYQLLFLGTLALAVGLSLKAGGLLLVFAFLVLPPVTGLLLGRGLTESTLVALGAAAGSSLLGFCAAIGLDLPVAPTVAAVQLVLLGLAAGARLHPRAGVAVRWFVAAAAAVALLAVPATLIARAASRSSTDAASAGRGGSAGTGAGAGTATGGGAGGSPASGPTQLPVAGGHQEHGHEDGDLDRAIQTLAHGGTPDERRLAAERLAQAAAPRALVPLLRALGDEDPRVADAAGVAVERLASAPEVLTKVEELSRGPDPDLRVHAADAWLRLGDGRGLEAYVTFLGQDDIPVLERERILGSLQALNGGDALGYDAFEEPAHNAAAIAAWKAWWAKVKDRIRWDRERRAFRVE